MGPPEHVEHEKKKKVTALTGRNKNYNLHFKIRYYLHCKDRKKNIKTCDALKIKSQGLHIKPYLKNLYACVR